MQFRSKAQRRYLYKHHPKLAADFAKKTPKGTKLPDHAPIKAKRHRHRKKGP